MKTSVLATVLIALAGPALAQAPTSHDQHHPSGTTTAQAQPAAPAQPQAAPGQSGMPMPMGQMMQGQMMGRGMMQGQGMPGSMMNREMMGRFSAEDMSAFADAHIAAIHAGLRLSADQEKLWPPVEIAIRNLTTLHLSHMQAMHQARGMAASDPVGMLRAMADRMGQGADAMRKLTDAASPLYAALDEAQKRRLQVLVRMGGRGMMGQGMMMMGRGTMRPGGAMMPGGAGDDDDDNQESR